MIGHTLFLSHKPSTRELNPVKMLHIDRVQAIRHVVKEIYVGLANFTGRKKRGCCTAWSEKNAVWETVENGQMSELLFGVGAFN